MTWVAALLLFLACLVAPWLRPRRRSTLARRMRGDEIAMLMSFGIAACLVGSMQAASRVGKHGAEISERAAESLGLLFIVFGAGMALAARRGFLPQHAGDSGRTIDQVLLWGPALVLVLLQWCLDVPAS